MMTSLLRNLSQATSKVHIHPNNACAKFHFIYPNITDFTEGNTTLRLAALIDALFFLI